MKDELIVAMITSQSCKILSCGALQCDSLSFVIKHSFLTVLFITGLRSSTVNYSYSESVILYYLWITYHI